MISKRSASSAPCLRALLPEDSGRSASRLPLAGGGRRDGLGDGEARSAATVAPRPSCRAARCSTTPKADGTHKNAKWPRLGRPNLGHARLAMSAVPCHG